MSEDFEGEEMPISLYQMDVIKRPGFSTSQPGADHCCPLSATDQQGDKYCPDESSTSGEDDESDGDDTSCQDTESGKGQFWFCCYFPAKQSQP